ncbi:MAG: cytochrome c-type biogenesis CcmF C-terminal domain-containing protein [Bacteroidota bacterium]
MIGGILVKAGFAAALASSFLYFLVARSQRPRDLHLARLAYYGAVVSLVAAGGVLLNLILAHQFQFTYVWSYSSTDLSLPLLISTFYAGQEGSFMLWALYTSLIGVFLMSYTARKGYEAEVMSVYGLIVSFLMLMLVVKNPFAYIWDSFPADLLQTGPIPAGMTNAVVIDAARNLWARFPAQGKGLNPLLQNYWMVIHPQILFMGFSSMAVPYAMAIGGLWKRDYHSWVRVATPWAVFGAMVLGTGIILGGYWAYETLGWGGFWGWDPVENSSLVPWLICVATIHTSLTQRKSGSFVRTNFALSMLAFIAVLYSTFLTRSGILGETSVHSFVDPGMWVYWLLMICMLVFTGIGFGLLFIRMREMPKIPVEHSMLSRDFALFLGAASLTLIALFVLVGTSAPIITSIAKGKASAVDIMYYVRTNLPLGIAITFLSGLGQLLWWRSSRMSSLLRRLIWPVGLAVALTAVIVLMGWEEPLILLFVFTSSFSLVANMQVGLEIYRGNPKFAGGALAHIGIAVMCLGFVTSERYDKKQTLSLERGKPVEALGYTLTYTGPRMVEAEKYGFVVAVEKDGQRREVAPVMYVSNFTESIMRHPDLINYLDRDFYVAPMSLEEATTGARERALELERGVPKAVGGLSVTFRSFDLKDANRDAMLEGKPFEIRMVLGVRDGDAERPIALRMTSAGGSVEFPTMSYTDRSGGVYEFRIARLRPDQDETAVPKVELAVRTPEDRSMPGKEETLVIEASVKPYINLVWVGTVTLVVGFLLTIIRRVQEARLKDGVNDDE